MNNFYPYPYLSGINYESVVDGPGVRVVIYLSGCTHNCKGCHNPQTHDPLFGQQITDDLIEQIADQIAAKPYLNGITLSGGDPLYNIELTTNFIKALMSALRKREHFDCTKSVWLYTGYKWAELMRLYETSNCLRELLSLIDVVVDGPFKQSMADKTLAFKGSSNQRIINVRDSISQNKIIQTINGGRYDNY